jgi:hypothetical protein
LVTLVPREVLVQHLPLNSTTYAWHNNIQDLAAWNSALIEEVDLEEFHKLLGADNWQNPFDGNEDTMMELYDDTIVVEL